MLGLSHKYENALLAAAATALLAVAVALAAFPAQAAPEATEDETCKKLQLQIQQILLQAVRQRNSQRKSPILLDGDSAQHDPKQSLDAVEQRAREAGCLPTSGRQESI